MQLAVVWERRSVLCCLDLQESAFSFGEYVFTFNLFLKKLHNYCAFNYISKDNVAMKCTTIQHNGSRGSSVSIVSGDGLDDLAIEVRSPAEAR
jgi:hypothetical protein